MAEVPSASVLRVIARLNVGGPAQQAILLTASLRQRYPTVLVTGFVGAGESEMTSLAERHGVQAVRIPELGRNVRPLDDLVALWKLWRLCRRIRPEIVHTHTAKAGTLGRIAALCAGVPIRVHTFHGHVFRGYFGRFQTAFFLSVERLLARVTTRIVAISPLQATELRSLLLLQPHRVTVVSLGLELERFAPREDDAAARRRFRSSVGALESDTVVTIVGRLTAIKNHQLALRALARVLPARPDVLLVFVGGGEEEGALRRLAARLGVESRVRFAGWWDDLPAVYQGTDLVALSSLNEGTPVCLIEALASSRPVVATAVGGVPDVLDAGRLGEMVPSGDEVALASAIETVLGRTSRPDDLRAIAQEVRHRYSIERLSDDVANLYDELGKRGSQRGGAPNVRL